jgi:cytochrome oxidase Cu insertion factor (SCO1/SenC/PrrC family)
MNATRHTHALLLLALAAAQGHAADPFDPVETGRTAPAQTLDFALHDVFGREVRASDYRRVPLLLEFGACW